jgi:hypothetical protein
MNNRTIPEGLQLLHRCDNPACVNINHLFVGSQQDNIDDMMSKGRHHRLSGESAPFRKLTKEQVLLIASIPIGAQTRFLARSMGVSRGTIQKIRTGFRWSTVTGITKEQAKT